jgi:hypothetical protein
MKLNPLRAFPYVRLLERANEALVSRLEDRQKALADLASRTGLESGIPESMALELRQAAEGCTYRYRVGVKSMEACPAAKGYPGGVLVTFTGFPPELLGRIAAAGYAVYAWNRDENQVTVSRRVDTDLLARAQEALDRTA